MKHAIEHVHEWQMSAGWFTAPYTVYRAFCIADEDCKAALNPMEINRRLNATERLSAEAAKDIIAWEGGASGRIANMKNWCALRAYANILEGKDD